MRRLILCLMLPLLLAACSGKSVYAPDAAVQAAIYRHGPPTTISLYTMINNRSGEGGHSALLVNGSQRALFDPAGTWYNTSAPERNDVHFGITPRILDIYHDYHARTTYHVVIQTVVVPPEVAERALREIQAYGAVPSAFCAYSTSTILGRLPGFEGVQTTYLPAKLMKRFAEGVPGEVTQKIYDDDPDDNSDKLFQTN